MNMNDLTELHCSRVAANSLKLAPKEIRKLCASLPGWTSHSKKGVLHLEKSYLFKDFQQAMVFTDQVAQLADKEDHHPAILTEWGKVTVTWWTHKINGLHLNDFIMAAKTEHLFSQ